MNEIHAQQVYQRTAKGEAEIATRAHHLPARQRSVLVTVAGGLTGQELLRRAMALGDGQAMVEALLADGFIAASATTPVSAKSATVAAESSDAHRAAARFAARFLLDTLGPSSDELGARIESCRDAAALEDLLRGCRDLIEDCVGKKKAEQFRAGVAAHLPALA